MIDLRLGDCLKEMKKIHDGIVDLVVTSPPYDKLRDYKGFTFNFEGIAKELLRIIKQGGVIVWVVGDQTINGSESGTSFRQALYFKELGFNLHDTMIYAKKGCPFPESNRYNQKFEYMFIFSKEKPKTTNLLKQKTLYIQNELHKSRSSTTRNPDGSMEAMKYETNKEYCTRYNIWEYAVGYQKTTKYTPAFQHPAMFPEALAKDHIQSWSNKGDLVLDPFCGSGTTGVAAKELGRNFIGIDVNPEYIKIAKQRLLNTMESLF